MRNLSGLKRGGSPGRPPGKPNRTTAALKGYVHSIAGEDGKQYLDKLHWVAIGEHLDTASRLKAIGMLLERGWGRPKEEIELTGLDGEPIAYRFLVTRASDTHGRRRK